MKKIWLFLLPLSLCLISCGDEVEEIIDNITSGTPSDSIQSTPSDSIQTPPDTPSDSIHTPEYGLEAVDLGLSVKWASCNLGATSPEQKGSYFAWGETTPKDSFPASWNTYKYYDFEKNAVTKYTKADSLKVLLPEDDAAQAQWGGEWRMPTHEEFNELVTSCERIDSTLNGVPCAYLKAPNGNGIFLPTTGIINGTTLFYPDYYSYWTSSLFTKSSPCKYAIASRGDLTDGTRMPSNRYRFVGLPIRPVRP